MCCHTPAAGARRVQPRPPPRRAHGRAHCQRWTAARARSPPPFRCCGSSPTTRRARRTTPHRSAARRGRRSRATYSTTAQESRCSSRTWSGRGSRAGSRRGRSLQRRPARRRGPRQGTRRRDPRGGDPSGATWRRGREISRSQVLTRVRIYSCLCVFVWRHHGGWPRRVRGTRVAVARGGSWSGWLAAAGCGGGGVHGLPWSAARCWQRRPWNGQQIVEKPGA